MSYSSNVKKELTDHMSKARHCRLAELSAILKMAGEVDLFTGELRLESESSFLVDKADRILGEVYGIHGAVCVRRGCAGSKVRQYILWLDNPAEVRRIVKDTGILDDEEQKNILQRSCCRQAYIRGAFLAGGSINDPEKNYHIEILFEEEKAAGRVREFLEDYDIASRVIERTRSGGRTLYVLYLKDGEQILDLLSVMKAHQALMELENVRITKDFRNRINRQVNCETANLNKTVSASVKQAADIRYLMETDEFALLPPELKQMAQVRLENPNTSLKDLGQYLEPPVSKSGVNHRLRRLSEIAERLREENKIQHKT